MNFIIDNFYIIFALLVSGILLTTLIARFFSLPSDQQLEKVREWLLWACIQAEKELGEKTGKAKLMMVYDMFISKFTWLAKVLTFDMFSYMVTESVEKMTHLLETNEQLANYVKGK